MSIRHWQEIDKLGERARSGDDGNIIDMRGRRKREGEMCSGIWSSCEISGKKGEVIRDEIDIVRRPRSETCVICNTQGRILRAVRNGSDKCENLPLRQVCKEAV